MMSDFIARCIGFIIEREPNPESNTTIFATNSSDLFQFLLFVS